MILGLSGFRVQRLGFRVWRFTLGSRVLSLQFRVGTIRMAGLLELWFIERRGLVNCCRGCVFARALFRCLVFGGIVYSMV